MIVWAVFICIASIQRCEMTPSGVFETRSACEHMTTIYNAGLARSRELRYVCLERRVETWRAPERGR